MIRNRLRIEHFGSPPDEPWTPATPTTTHPKTKESTCF